MNERRLRWFRFQRSGLATPFESEAECAAALFGVQAQILPSSAISLWNRSSLQSYEEFQTKLWEERQLLKLWGQRGTLHLYNVDDWPLLTAARRLKRSYWAKQWEKAGREEEDFRTLVSRLDALALELGILDRKDVKNALDDIDSEWLSSWGGIFTELVREGQMCHAPPVGSRGQFAHRSHWVPELAWNEPGIEEANIELARRYIRAHGPCNVRDLAHWRGASLGDARRWWDVLEDECFEVDQHGNRLLIEDKTAWEEAEAPGDDWPMRLLHRFDPLVLAHKEKSWLLDMKYYKLVWRKAAHVEPVVMVDGRLVANWKYKRSGRKFHVQVEAFESLAQPIQRFVKDESEQLATFFGADLGSVTFDD